MNIDNNKTETTGKRAKTAKQEITVTSPLGEGSAMGDNGIKLSEGEDIIQPPNLIAASDLVAAITKESSDKLARLSVEEKGTVMRKPRFVIETDSVLNDKSGFSKKLLCDGLTFTAGQACAYSCSFCYVGSILGKNLRLREIGKEKNLKFEDMVVEIKNAAEKMTKKLTRRGKAKKSDTRKRRVIYGSPLVDIAATMEQARVTVKICQAILKLTNWDNPDFFAGLLGGGREQSHHVIYFEPEMQWYFRDSDHVYKPTSSEKLADLHRALMMKCAQDMPAHVHKLNLFHEFRSDKTCRTIISRAKSIMAADHTFFSATSSFQRIKGTELFERLLRNLVDNMEPKEGACLTVTQAYQIFCELSQQRSLGALKRSRFKEMMRELIRERFNLALRHDVPDSENKHQQAWRGLRLVKMDALAA